MEGIKPPLLYGIALAALALIVLVAFLVLTPQRDVDSPSGTEGALERAASVDVPSVAPNANPLQHITPSENPVEKTNPFKNDYKNPFE